MSLEDLVRYLYPAARAQVILELLKGVQSNRAHDTVATGSPDAAVKPSIKLEVEGKALSKEHTLYPRDYSIGRENNCDINLCSDPCASRLHCVLRVHASGAVEVIDLHSKNGVLVNEVPIPPAEWYAVKVEETIRVGQSFLTPLPAE